MNNTSLVATYNSLDNLLEEFASHSFFQDALLGDVIEQVFDGFWALHDNNKAVISLKIVKDLDNSLDVGNFA